MNFYANDYTLPHIRAFFPPSILRISVCARVCVCEIQVTHHMAIYRAALALQCKMFIAFIAAAQIERRSRDQDVLHDQLAPVHETTTKLDSRGKGKCRAITLT